MTVITETTTFENHAEAARTPSEPDANRPAENRSELAWLLAQAYIHMPSLIP